MSPRDEVVRRLAALPGFAAGPARRGHGSPFVAAGVEVAHFHSDGQMDVRLGRVRIQQRKADRSLDPRVRTRGPTADWASVPLGDPACVELAIALAVEAGEVARANAVRSAGGVASVRRGRSPSRAAPGRPGPVRQV